MNAFISRLKRIRFGQFLGVVVAGCLLLVSTACAGGAQAKTPDSPTSTPQINNPAKAYNVREATPEQGMNRHSDLDPRQGDAGAAAKSKALVDSSKRNLNRSGNVIENVKEAASDVRRNAARDGRDLTEKAKDAASKLSGETEKLVNKAPDRAAAQAQKVKENLYEAREQARDAAEKTVD